VRDEGRKPLSDEAAPKRVVGLQYEPEQGLPQVILKGAGPLAEELLQRRIGLGARTPPVVKDGALLEALYRLPVDGAIGPELFEAVAALLVHVFAVEARMKGERR
jgi:type III secretion system FlhB-like substrate exporter